MEPSDLVNSTFDYLHVQVYMYVHTSRHVSTVSLRSCLPLNGLERTIWNSKSSSSQLLPGERCFQISMVRQLQQS